ncbi:nuclear transport factor 2 family protein [Acidimangrovimonas sediminis]|uniref:nuclear transport factor 2 family protein n=1 Tax=Acidimangrovimonas sediminis TaxID=2056283 RepID=UPI000C7FAC25|nr:nuclear transport factor 2 family protein [Acidimangrovimonas sediminis]
MTYSTKLPDWLQDAMEALGRGDIDGWMQIYAPDAVHEFPFAPEGMPTRVEGKAAIAAYMGKLPGLIRFGEMRDIRVRTAGDEVIGEATGHHWRLPDETPVEIGYVWFITVTDGKVTHFRDYMNLTQMVQG